MKLVYLANVRMPTEKAHGLQIMQMCAAFASAGHDVTLIVPDRKNPIKGDAFAYYGIVPRFRIEKVPVFDAIRFSRWLGPLAVFLLEVSFARAARKLLARIQPDIIYSRDVYSNLWTSDEPLRVTEVHTLPKRFRRLYVSTWHMSDRVVATTEGLSEDLIGLGLPAERVTVAHDAVDLARFDIPMSREDARRALGLPTDRTIAVYVGRFYKEQGIETLIAATERMESDALVVLVGGTHPAGDRAKRKIVGRVPSQDIPLWLRAADIALMPYVGTSEHVSRWASPMKLFEYLGAGLPIIASDLPSVREVLTDDAAVFVRPDDPDALAKAIDALARDEERTLRMREASARLGKGRTWQARAHDVLVGLTRSAEARKSIMKWWPETGVALLALVTRLLYVLAFPEARLEGSDAGLYLGYADWMRGRIPWNEGWYATFQAGYPAFLAAIRAVLGESLVAIRIVQAVLGSAAVALVMWMGSRWASRGTGLAAGLILAVHVPSILQTGIVLTEGLYAFLVLLMAAGVAHALRKRTWRAAVIAALLAVLVGVTREIGYYSAIALTAFASWKRSWKTATLIPLAVVFAIMATSFAFARIAPASETEEAGLVTTAKGYEETVLTDRIFQENVLDPSRFMMWPEGIARFLLVPHRMTDLGSGISVKTAVFRADAGMLKLVWQELLAKTFVLLTHLAIIALAVIGLFRGALDRDLKIVIVLVGLVAGGSIILASVGYRDGFAAFAPLARYRFPLMPLIILLAGSGIMSLNTNRHEK